MPNPFQSEPAASAGVVMAIIYVLIAFGAPISPEQAQVLKDNLPIVLPGIAGLVVWIRQMVTPNATVQQKETAAFMDGVQAARLGEVA